MESLRFRVWDSRKAEYKKKQCSLLSSGKVLSNSGIESSHFIVEFFTGFVDRAGKEIYVNDILVENINYFDSQGGQVPPSIDIVSFYNGSFYWGKNPLFDFVNFNTLNKEIRWIDANIVGNINEHSALWLKPRAGRKSIQNTCPINQL